MASMNKPSSQQSDWYQAVTDNWTSIEKNLIDKNLVSAKGDLIVATGASALDRLGVGSNEQLLTSDSSTTAGVKWAGSIGLADTAYLNDALFDKRFFSAAGLLPGTKYYETPADTAPSVDWDTSGGVTTTIGPYRRWTGISGTQTLGWDLGGLKQRVLLIFSSMQMGANNERTFMTTQRAPFGGGFSGNGYAGGLDYGSGNGGVLKITNGSTTDLGASNYVSYHRFAFGSAMHFDNGNVRFFYRFGNRQWVEGTYKNDGTHTQVRHCGVWFYDGVDLTLGPVSIYYDN